MDHKREDRTPSPLAMVMGVGRQQHLTTISKITTDRVRNQVRRITRKNRVEYKNSYANKLKLNVLAIC